MRDLIMMRSYDTWIAWNQSRSLTTCLVRVLRDDNAQPPGLIVQLLDVAADDNDDKPPTLFAEFKTTDVRPGGESGIVPMSGAKWFVRRVPDGLHITITDLHQWTLASKYSASADGHRILTKLSGDWVLDQTCSPDRPSPP